MQRTDKGGDLTGKLVADAGTSELLKTAKLRVRYISDQETLLIRWEGTVTSEELRDGYTCLLELVRELKPVKWQLDLQKRSPIKREDQRWVFGFFFPQVLSLIKDDVFVAVVLPVSLMHDLVNQLSGDELMQEGNFLIIQHFMYPEEAQRWLNEMHLIKSGSTTSF